MSAFEKFRLAQAARPKAPPSAQPTPPDSSAGSDTSSSDNVSRRRPREDNSYGLSSLELTPRSQKRLKALGTKTCRAMDLPDNLLDEFVKV